MTALEDQMKSLEKEMAEKAKSLQNALKQLDKNSGKGFRGRPCQGPAKGPGRRQARQGARGAGADQQAPENNQMTDKEKEQLRKQMEKMQQKMERLAQQKDKKEQLQSRTSIRRRCSARWRNLQKQSQKLKDLQDLANEMSKCKECLKQGDSQSPWKA